MNLIDNITAARRVSTPLIGITTPDQSALMATVVSKVNGKTPIFKHDVIKGLQALNDAAAKVLAKVLDGVEGFTLGNPVEALQAAERMPGPTDTNGNPDPNGSNGAILFMVNANMFLGGDFAQPQQLLQPVQAIWNLRDQYKANHRTLILLGADMPIPSALTGDIVIFDDPPPTEAQLKTVVMESYEDGDLVQSGKVKKGVTLDVPIEKAIDLAVEKLVGMPSIFTADTATAMSLTPRGLNFDMLAERQRAAVMSATPGVTFYAGDEMFDQIGGCLNVKSFITRIGAGNGRPTLVLFFDEIEKQFGGLGVDGGPGDSSGTTKDQLMQMLTWMQDTRAAGLLFVGPPGAAKSVIAKATGRELGVTMLVGDLGATKDSLVGSSEARIRKMLATVTAMSRGNVLVIATCNSLAVLPPELKRRFKLGTFFFDLPTREEADIIWPLYEKKYNLVGQTRPDYTDWTGAEIEQCCEIAWRLKSDLKEAATFVVPIAKSSSAVIAALRTQANGCFISASTPGFYASPDGKPTDKARRKIKLADATIGPGGDAMDVSKPLN